MKTIGKIEISGREFYVSEIDSKVILESRNTGYNFGLIDKNIIHIIFRAEGRIHGTKKYMCRYFILTETNDEYLIYYRDSYIDRPRILHCNQDYYLEARFCESGPDRILLTHISESIKEDYLKERDKIKSDLRELISWRLRRK